MRSSTSLPAFAVLGFATALAACDPGEDSITVAGPPGPRPSVAISPSPVTIRQADTARVIIGIARTDYVGPVFVTFEGMPTGVVTPTVSSTSTNQFSIRISADSNAQLGTSTGRITASGIDVPVVAAQISVTVLSK